MSLNFYGYRGTLEFRGTRTILLCARTVFRDIACLFSSLLDPPLHLLGVVFTLLFYSLFPSTSYISNFLNLPIALLTYLGDSFEERITDDYESTESNISNVLRLHPSLSPVKAIILADEKYCEQQTELVARLSKELKTVGQII